MNNKKKILIASIISVMIASIGITYSIYVKRIIGTQNNKLIVGDIYMRYKEGVTKDIKITPSNTYRSDDYYEFTVEGKNQSSKDIIYSIELSHGEEINNKISSSN